DSFFFSDPPSTLISTLSLHDALPIFHLMISLGLALAIVVPTLLFFFGVPFFTHQHTYVTMPVFGEVALHTAVIFDVGVFLTVAGTSLLIVTLVGGTEK